MSSQNDGSLARLVAHLLVSGGHFTDEDVDAELNRRLAAMMDAEATDQPPD